MKMDERGKPVRLDDRLFELPDDLVILCLPEWFRSMLLSLCDRPFWGKRVWGRELSEQEIDRLEEGVYLLSVEECDMQITVNAPVSQAQEQNCGGGGGNGGDCSSPPPWADYPFPGGSPCYPVPPVNPPDDIPNPPVPPDDIEEDEWTIYRCKLANYWWDLARQWFQRIADAPSLLFTIGTILLFLWNALPAALLAAVGGQILELAMLILNLRTFIGATGLGEILSFAVDWWDENREELICKIFNATDIASVANEIRSDFLDNLVAFAELRPWWFTELFDTLSFGASKIMPLNLFTASWTLIPPPGYQSHTVCCADSETPVPTDAPTPQNPYYLLAAPAEKLTMNVNNNTGFVTYDGAGRYRLTPLTTQTYHEVFVEMEDMGWGLNPADTCHGLIVGLVEYDLPQFNNDGLVFSSNTGGALLRSAEQLVNTDNPPKWFCYYDNTEEPLHEYANDTDIMHSWYAYGNGAMNITKATFKMQTYGQLAPKQLGIVLLYIFKESES